MLPPEEEHQRVSSGLHKPTSTCTTTTTTTDNTHTIKMGVCIYTYEISSCDIKHMMKLPWHSRYYSKATKAKWTYKRINAPNINYSLFSKKVPSQPHSFHLPHSEPLLFTSSDSIPQLSQITQLSPFYPNCLVSFLVLGSPKLLGTEFLPALGSMWPSDQVLCSFLECCTAEALPCCYYQFLLTPCMLVLPGCFCLVLHRILVYLLPTSPQVCFSNLDLSCELESYT